MKCKISCLLVLLCAALNGESLIVSPGTERPQLDPITVWGSRPLFIGRSAQITVLTRAEIERSGARSVADLLEGQPGVQIERYGGNGQPAFIRLRGSSAAQAVILVDGVRAAAGGSGTVDLASLSLNNIEKIEIIRGGNGALYGSGAVGGAINIITRAQSRRNMLHLESGYGSWQTVDLLGRCTGSAGAWQWQLSGYYGSSDGGYTFPGQQQGNPDGSYTLDGEQVTYLNSGYQQYGATAILSMTAKNSRHTLQWSGSFREAGVPGTIEFPTVEAVQKDLRTGAGWNSRFRNLFQNNDQLELQLQWQYLQRDYRDFQLYQDASSHLNRQVSGEVNWSGGSAGWKINLKSGGSYSFLESNSFGEGAGGYRSTVGYVFAGVARCFGRAGGFSLTVNPAVRLETASLYGTRFSPGIGAVAETGSGRAPRLKVNFNRVYRAPSFDELFWPAGWFAEGNSELEPEHGWSWDAGFEWRLFPNWQVTAAYFGSRMKDLIYWQPGPGGVWKPLNLSGAQINGLEAGISFRVLLGGAGMLKFSGNYTLQFVLESGDPLTEGNQLPRRPHETGAFQAEWVHPGLGFVRGEFKYTGFRYLNRANTKYLGDYLTVDMTAGIRLPAGFEFRIAVRNLLDQAYIHLLGHPVPGREFGIRLSWKQGAL